MNVNNFYSFNSAEVDTYVVYDKAQGNIVHVHQVINLPGAAPTNADAAKAAHEHASACSGCKAESLEVLQVAPNQLELGKQYKVDPRKKLLHLIETAPGARSN